MTNDERAARQRCRGAGLNPDFVGTKGYPNWRDFMFDRLDETLRELADVREFIRMA